MSTNVKIADRLAFTALAIGCTAMISIAIGDKKFRDGDYEEAGAFANYAVASGLGTMFLAGLSLGLRTTFVD